MLGKCFELCRSAGLSSCSAVSGVWVLGLSCLGCVQALFGRQNAWRLGKRFLWGHIGASLALFGCLAVWWLGELFLRGLCLWSALG